jgi:hypothetical protein
MIYGDVIDLAGITVTSATVTGTTLTVIASNGTTLHYQLSGTESASAFKVVSDVADGSDLILIPSISWATGKSGDWGDAAHWSAGTVPGINDDAVISKKKTYTITSSSNNAVYDLTLKAAGAALAINDGTTFEIGGSIVTDDGTIALDSSSSLTRLQIDGAATLKGTGTVLLSDSAQNMLVGAGTGSSLVNEASIVGAGQIGSGDGHLTFENKSTILADQDVALVIDTGNVVTNTGTSEAAGSGGLIIDDTVKNAGSAAHLFADGGDLTIMGAVTGGGTATIAGATLDFRSTSRVNVSFASSTGALALDDAGGFTGTVAGLANGPGNAIDLTGIQFAGAQGSSQENSNNTQGTLAVTDGSHSASITLLGQYANTFTESPSPGYVGFVLADDGTANHGTLVTYQA